MNTKIAIILGVGILVMAGAVGFLILKNPQKNGGGAQKPANEPTTATQNNVSVVYDGKTFIPLSLILKKGDSVNFLNTTDKNIVVRIDGKLAAPLVFVDSGKTGSYSLQEDGNYTFTEVSEIINKTKGSQKPFPSAIPTTEQKSVSVAISTSGFSPNKLAIDTNTKVVFVNKTGKDFSIKPLSSNIIPGNIFPSNLNREMVFPEGEYNFVNKNNTSQTLEIVVKK